MRSNLGPLHSYGGAQMAFDVHFASIAEQGRLFRERRLSPLELTKVYLERIRRFDEQLNAFVDVFEEAAIAEARRATDELMSGLDRGPLHGIPFAVKDIFALRGRLPTGGSSLGGVRLAAEEATVIQKLRTAGAVLIGALNTHELQFGITRRFPFGTPRNPWDTKRATGGSSAGSASAVAAGLCAFSLGGDTGASIRTPASLCGVVGLRPTWSRVSRYGAMSVLPALDTVGPIGRFVEDVAVVLGVIAGHDADDKTSSLLPVPDYGAQIETGGPQPHAGAVTEMLDPGRLEQDVATRVDEAIQALNLATSIEQTSLPLISRISSVFPTMVFSEVGTRYRRLLQESLSSLDSNTRGTLLAAAALPASAVIRARQASALVARQVLAAFDEYEVLVGATTHRTAGIIPEDSGGPAFGKLHSTLNGRQGSEGQGERRAFSLAGVPAVSVPCGLDRNGLPVGFHIAGRPFQEGRVLRTASLVQSHFGWEPPPAFL